MVRWASLVPRLQSLIACSMYVLWSGTAPPGVCHLSAWYLPALPPPYLPFWVDPFLVLWTRNGIDAAWTHSGLQPSDRHHMKVYCLSSWRQSHVTRSPGPSVLSMPVIFCMLNTSNYYAKDCAKDIFPKPDNHLTNTKDTCEGVYHHVYPQLAKLMS